MNSATYTSTMGRRALLSSDAKKLLIVLAIFNWSALLLLSRSAPVDFVAFYMAGKLILSGQRHLLFSLPTQTYFQTVTLGKAGVLAYYHPAFEGLLFAPFSALSMTVGLWVWRIALVALLMGACRWIAATYRVAVIDVFVFAAGFFSVAVAIAQGQDSILLLAVFALTFILVREDRDSLAGTCFAFGLFKPQLVLPVALVLCWKRGRPFVISFLTGTLLVAAVSTLVTGYAGWIEWFELVKRAGSESGADIGAVGSSMLNIRGLVLQARFVPILANLLIALLSAAVLVLVCWCIHRENDPERYFPPLVATSLLVSFHLNAHDVVLLLIPMVYVASRENLPAMVQVCIGVCFALPVFLILGMLPWMAFVIFAILLAALSVRPKVEPA